MDQSLTHRFDALTDLLRQTQSWWRPRAFHSTRLPWMDQYPALAGRLLALSPQQVRHLAADSAALTEFLSPDLPFAHTLAELTRIPDTPRRTLPPLSPHLHTGIPGRKWQQVETFVGSLPGTKLPILEWCAGKSHLGHILYHYLEQPVTALEWDRDLVRQANTRARREGIDLHSYAVDVLSAAADDLIKPSQQVVALHACGDLHERLLQLCAEKKVQQIHLAPCCYHKRRDNRYQPLSRRGQTTDLELEKADLHTAVTETATAGATIRRQRIRMQVMRLGFDCLQRELRNTDEFLPVPSVPARWAGASFEEFCRHCAELKQVDLPESLDWQHYQQLGEQRFRQVAALDLVRFLFRRPLEVWLVLDRALMLQEHNYTVQLGTFCSASITPRNLLIQGNLTDSSGSQKPPETDVYL